MAFTVTITARRSDNDAPLERVSVRLSAAGVTYYNGTTGADGVVTFTATPRTYVLSAALDLYSQPGVPQSLVVADDTSVAVEMDPVSAVAPDDVAQTVLTGYVRDGAGNVWPNGKLNYRLVALPDGASAVGYRGATKTVTGDGVGLIQEPILKNAEYLLWIDRGEEHSLITGSADVTDLPAILGGQAPPT